MVYRFHLSLLIELVLLCLAGASSSTRQEDPSNVYSQSILSNGHQQGRVVAQPRFENVFPGLVPELDTIELALKSLPRESPCRRQGEQIISGLRQLRTWAVKFYDASGKFPGGVLAGSHFELGNFDECLNIGTEGEESAPVGVSGQYCLTEIDVRVPESFVDIQDTIWWKFQPATKRYEEYISKLHWAVCAPASCPSHDIETVLAGILSASFNSSELSLHPRVQPQKCYKNQPISVSTADIIYVCILLSITSTVITGTIFHVFYRWKGDIPKGVLSQILVAFSLISNWKKLIGPAHKDDLNLECISGIKFVSMALIVAGHSLIFVVSGPIVNEKFWKDAVYKVENAVFLNNPLLVDTFLFLSGFLFCRILLRELDKRKSINFLLLYFYRYLRLTPAYMVVVGLYVTWLSKLDSGPFWSRMQLEQERCLKSWWTNILYINNYVNTDNICMFQSWYLSVDTQLFILAPAIIYPLWRWRKPGEIILASVTAISVLIPFAMTLLNNLDPTLMVYRPEVKDISTNEYFKTTYIKTHMRASAYCFGLVFGYVVHRIQIDDIRISKRTLKFSWLLCSLSLAVSMFSVSIFYGPRQNYTAMEAAVYSALHRAFWSIGTGWILVVCITNNSGPLKNFLKWRPFVPLSRLTYTAYLINGFVELHGSSTIRVPQYLSRYNLLCNVLSHLLLTFGGAVILSMTFESPILGIERIFLKNERKSADSDCMKKTDSEETTITES